MIEILHGVINKDDSVEFEGGKPPFVCLEANSIGYHIYVTDSTRQSILSLVASVEKLNAQPVPMPIPTSPPTEKLYIHEHISEDAHDLYGFDTAKERWLFRQIMTTHGVGAKTAMKIMNIAPPAQLVQVIRMGNQKYLERGVSEKVAANVILKLGGKIDW